MKSSLLLFLKGMAMGAADVVPGVSGGTIALVAGIYDRLIDAIKSVGVDTLIALKKEGVRSAWKQMDGTFLLVLFSGILTSILLLAKGIHYLIEIQPVLVWSFFFGLVAASAVYVGGQIKQWRSLHAGLLLAGCVGAATISLMSPTSIEVTFLSLFLSGALAICAMILPGISGSFILLLLGMYSPVIAAVKSLEVANLLIFASGCLVGLLVFSRLLSWLLHHYHSQVIAVLTGFMIGALFKIWPWKMVLSYRVNSAGKQVPLDESLIWPTEYVTADPQISLAVIFIILGASIIFIFNKLGKTSN